jgi:aspartate/tyrosine/aromatic aminotransferase
MENNICKTTSKFSNIPDVKDSNKIFDAVKKFEANTNPNKMNLSIGMFLDDLEKVIEFESVRRADEILISQNLNKEYPQIGGGADFCRGVLNLFFPQDHPVVKESRHLVVQTITGGASLKLGAEIINKFLENKIHLSEQTFPPYKNLFSQNLEISYYPYFNKTDGIDIDAMVEYLSKINEKSVINLQLSSHNPTSLDPNISQWDKIAAVMKQKKHLAFFDVAYLGYASGNISTDLYPIHKFAQEKIEMIISYSSAKNFANYSDDVGALIIVLNNPEPLIKLKSHLIVFSRSLFSFVSLYGPRVMEKILTSEELYKIWITDQQNIHQRINAIRSKIIEEIEKNEIRGININLLRNQTGIYMYLNLSEKQVEELMEKYAIFLCEGGRINITGVGSDKVGYLVSALKDVCG